MLIIEAVLRCILSHYVWASSVVTSFPIEMRKFNAAAVASLLLSAMLLPSCATIISTPFQTVRVVGQPAGSTVLVNDQPAKTKPVPGMPDAVSVRLSRRKSAEIKVKHDGYKDYSEVLNPDRMNPVAFLNYGWGAAALVSIFSAYTPGYTTVTGSTKVYTPASLNFTPMYVGLGLMLVTPLIDVATGAARKFNKDEVQAHLVRRPVAASGSQSVQCSMVNVRIKGGDKMGNVFIGKDPKDIIYFGKTLDVNADDLRSNVNNTLKDVGYSVPSEAGKSVFSTAPTSRFALQGEMRDIKYDIHSSSPYASLAHFETAVTVEVTWKLLNASRQPVIEQKTSGSSIRFENGGTAAFEDAFENALYAFLERPEVAAALAMAGPVSAASASPTAGAEPAKAKATDNLAAISVQRPAPLKPNGDNGISAAAHCVVTVETADGHGSGCLISADGYLITNAHVVGNEASVKVQLPDGLLATGTVVRVNTDLDLALVKVEVDGLTAFRLPSTTTAELGTDVYAIGTPADKELGQTVTKGIISGRRKIEGHVLLQTDVSINGGSSGGALVTRAGQLLGIVNAKLVGRGIEGIGFAIPAEQVSEALQLKFVD